jgi:hypothetical protein
MSKSATAKMTATRDMGRVLNGHGPLRGCSCVDDIEALGALERNLCSGSEVSGLISIHRQNLRSKSKSEESSASSQTLLMVCALLSRVLQHLSGIFYLRTLKRAHRLGPARRRRSAHDQASGFFGGLVLYPKDRNGSTVARRRGYGGLINLLILGLIKARSPWIVSSYYGVSTVST